MRNILLILRIKVSGSHRTLQMQLQKKVKEDSKKLVMQNALFEHQNIPLGVECTPDIEGSEDEIGRLE